MPTQGSTVILSIQMQILLDNNLGCPYHRCQVCLQKFLRKSSITCHQIFPRVGACRPRVQHYTLGDSLCSSPGHYPGPRWRPAMAEREQCPDTISLQLWDCRLRVGQDICPQPESIVSGQTCWIRLSVQEMWSYPGLSADSWADQKKSKTLLEEARAQCW